MKGAGLGIEIIFVHIGHAFSMDIPGNFMISVITPFYNAKDTLPMAIASVFCQTHSDWEIILIDDGSTDDPEPILNAVRTDPRVRIIRFTENRGRGAARKAGLDAAVGDFLAMVDADDWIYPEKLERQLNVLTNHPECVAVTAGMGILGKNGMLVGIRTNGRSGIRYPAQPNRFGSRGVSFATLLIRMSAARNVGFRIADRVAEDHFICEYIRTHTHIVTNDILYAYDERNSLTRHNFGSVYQHSREIAFEKVGFRSFFYLLESYSKAFIIKILVRLGMSDLLLRLRTKHAEISHISRHNSAKTVIDSCCAKMFTGAAIKHER